MGCRGGCACRPIKAYIKFLVERLREDALLGELCEDAPSEFAAVCGSQMDEILASIWGFKIGSIWGPKTGSNLDSILERDGVHFTRLRGQHFDTATAPGGLQGSLEIPRAHRGSGSENVLVAQCWLYVWMRSLLFHLRPLWRQFRSVLELPTVHFGSMFGCCGFPKNLRDKVLLTELI